MKIAVYVDSFGNAADIFGQGHIEVFEKHAGCWHRHQQQEFDVNESMNLDAIRKCAFDLSEKLADCRVLVLKSIPGVLQAFFEGCGFKLWKMTGAPDTHFNFIEEYHFTKNDSKKECYELFTEEKRGIFSIDMNKLLTENNALTSRSLLIPFIKNKSFSRLIVVCNHIPKWFTKELPALGFDWTEEKLSSGLIIAAIEPDNT